MKVLCYKCKKISKISKLRTWISKKFKCSCGYTNHEVYELPINSQDFTDNFVIEMEKACNNMQFELVGDVYLLQRKDEQTIIRDKIDPQYALQALVLAIKEKLYETERNSKEHRSNSTADE